MSLLERTTPLPWTDEPAQGGVYTLNGLSRDAVTRHNHGLHKYPAKFVPQLAQWGLNYRRERPAEIVLDPFCGSGTTNLEAALAGHQALGVDVSPLAVLIASAKTFLMPDAAEASRLVGEVVDLAKRCAPAIEAELEQADDWGLHFSWRNWFRVHETAKVLALRNAIEERAEDDGTRGFLLACLSSALKRSSYLSEDQIKVRFDKEKIIADPLTSFATIAGRAIPVQANTGQQIAASGGSSGSVVGSATELPIASHSVHRVVTSPPYINAVDYTMAHKYNLFALGLINPEQFKEHCRSYIGVTERAVRSVDLADVPDSSGAPHHKVVIDLWAEGRPVTRNRAFVVHQYFDGMARSFDQMFRVLVPGGLVVMVIGTTNRICGRTVTTAQLVEAVANVAGFGTELKFEHALANRSSMRLNRSSTGGEVKTETVLVLRRP